MRALLPSQACAAMCVNATTVCIGKSQCVLLPWLQTFLIVCSQLSRQTALNATGRGALLHAFQGTGSLQDVEGYGAVSIYKPSICRHWTRTRRPKRNRYDKRRRRAGGGRAVFAARWTRETCKEWDTGWACDKFWGAHSIRGPGACRRRALTATRGAEPAALCNSSVQ
jgi:hypothetical protein